MHHAVYETNAIDLNKIKYNLLVFSKILQNSNSTLTTVCLHRYDAMLRVAFLPDNFHIFVTLTTECHGVPKQSVCPWHTAWKSYPIVIIFDCLSCVYLGLLVLCITIYSLELLVLMLTWVIVFKVQGITCTTLYLGWLVLMSTCDYLFCCLPGIACLGVYMGLLGLHCCKSSERFGLKCEFSLVSNKYIPNIHSKPFFPQVRTCDIKTASNK